MKKSTLIIIILLIVALLGGWFFWFMYLQGSKTENPTNIPEPNSFNPLNREPAITKLVETPEKVATTTTEIPSNTPLKLPILRKLSDTPVGGMAASTTASTTIVRFIDRGAGYIYEASNKNNNIENISNTTLPRIYESYWNKNLNVLVLRYLKQDSNTITNFYAEIRKTSTSTSVTSFEIKGKYLSTDINEIVVAPTGDKIFTWNIEGGRGMGYISSFDEKNKVKIADTPITQVLIEWPEINTVTINTKASSGNYGYLYSIDTKTGAMKKMLGGLRGLSTKISKDMKQTLLSITKSTGFNTLLYNSKDESGREVIFKTLADKCVWSTLRKNEIYCAVPTNIPDGDYPDDWYRGNVQFVDQIWHLDTITGEVHLLANPLNLANELIDATQLILDQKEKFLYFINKRDLTLWSLDLNR
ncbi:MAG: hypothetical protein AAB637_00340, partial [Patescibacteria group bacterium]